MKPPKGSRSFPRGRGHTVVSSPNESSTPGLVARMAAARALAEAVSRGRSLEDRRAGAPNPLAGLDPRDQALARAINAAALRRLGTIRKALAQLMKEGFPKKSGSLEWILIVAAAQILFLGAADHAAVDLAVRAARADPNAAQYAALVNGVLRSMIRERETILAASDPLADDAPGWLAARWRKTYGPATAAAIAAAHREEPALDITVKSHAEDWARRLGGVVLPTGSVRIETHEPIRSLDGYETGEWWVQDAAASLPARLVAAGPRMRIADLCAAPGGKSAQLVAAGAEVTAVDRSAERLKRLAENFERLRLDVEVAVADALAFEASPFDAVLLDAPCSATGTIRRHPDVAWTKRPSDLVPLGALQAQLLDRAVALVKPGGLVVFCTCSLEPEEGEAQIAALLRRNPDVRRVAIEAGEIGGLAECLSGEGDLRTLPCHLPAARPRFAGLDGFFASRVQRLR